MSDVIINNVTYADVPSIVIPKDGGGYAVYTEGGGGGSVLMPKTITTNGTYDPANDSVDGYSAITANVDLVQVATLPTMTVLLKNTEYDTWTPSTTAKAIYATQVAGTFTATDIAQHNYFVRIRGYVDVQYQSGTSVAKGMFQKCCIENWNCISKKASNAANLNSGTMNSTVNESVNTTYLNKYYNGGWVAIYSSAYGFYPSNTNPSISSTSATSPTITVNTPVINAKCNATYFSTTMAGKVDKDASSIKFVFNIYRADVGYMRSIVNSSLKDMWQGGLS